ncbi:MAG: hypothetical protein AAB371_00845 [Patescibacteria group bacterium]
MLFFKKRILGIDFGSKFVKIIELEKSGRNLNLVNYSVTSILWEDSSSYPLGATQLFEENLASILKEGTKDFKTKDAIFVLPASFLFSTFFSLPNIPKKAIQETIEYESRKYIPFDSDDIEIQTKIFSLKNQYQPDKTRTAVFLVGIPNGLTEKLKTSAYISGLNYKKGEPEFFVYEPFFYGNSGVSVLVHMDLNYSLIYLFYNGQLVFGKKLKFRLYNLIDSISKLLDTTFVKAEEFLAEKKFNIPEENKDIKDAVSVHFGSVYNEIQEEINNIADKFGFKTDGIFVSGSPTEIPGFLEFFQNCCGKIKINALDPFSRLQNVPNNSNILNKSPIFGGAVGACMKYLK